MNNLSLVCNTIREDLELRNAARDQAIVLSRQLFGTVRSRFALFTVKTGTR